MDRTENILKTVAETIYEEEGLFFVTLNADETGLPLEGTQRLVFGGNATPNLKITEEGISASLSMNRVHYAVDIPWRIIFAVEGADKAFYCRQKSKRGLEGDGPAGKGKESRNRKKMGHLKVVK